MTGPRRRIDVPLVPRSSPRPRSGARALVPLAAVALVAAGCGQTSAEDADAASSPSPSTSSSPSSGVATIGTCDPADPALGRGTVVARADLDGDGRREEVRRTTVSGCSGYLVATVEGRTVGAAPDDPAITPTTVRAVTLPGRDGQLLVVNSSHPRGGLSTSVLAYADRRLSLLERPGDTPLMPFQPTDVTPATSLLSLSCGDGGSLVLREAVEHQPVGIVAAFDVQETTFELRGADLTVRDTTEIADNVLPADLPRRFPAIEDRRVLVDGCD